MVNWAIPEKNNQGRLYGIYRGRLIEEIASAISQKVFQKSMSSTPPVWFFSGIAHSHMAEPMVTTQCFIVLKSSKSIQLLCHY